jgi:hypothetical protein
MEVKFFPVLTTPLPVGMRQAAQACWLLEVSQAQRFSKAVLWGLGADVGVLRSLPWAREQHRSLSRAEASMAAAPTWALVSLSVSEIDLLTA